MKPLHTLRLYRCSFCILSILFIIFSGNNLKAQTEIITAKQYLKENATKLKLVDSDINEMTVSSAYLSPTTGWYHVYFSQNYQSVEVYNSMINMVLQKKQVQHTVSNFVQNIASRASTVNLKNISLGPLQAFQKATSHLKLTASEVSKVKEIIVTKLQNGIIKKATYGDTNLSDENIEVTLYWLPIEVQVGEKMLSNLKLSWNVRLLTKDKQNKWSILVDALSGEILRQKDEVIHCNFGTPNHLKNPHVCVDEAISNDAKRTVAANNYNVFDIPLESPNHGARSLVSSPYTRFVPTGTGPGLTNGWHNDGTTDYTTTRGNNVYAKEDIANSNGTGASPSSPILEFNHPYTFGVNTSTGNRDAAITNLFYWNNLIHDILWKYGFDEPSGNFQNNNQGRGGLGNDFVYADAQDGGGSNNANFSTPADGGNGRMQMYLWSNAGTPSYQPDGDFDNGIIAHEYGHGWSLRLTGGPANSSCLQNAEQGGEGWSDYAALMFSTNWATLTPTIASANIPRGIGTYALGQPITGAGIRPYRYSYDKTNINNVVTYAKVGDANFSQPHGIGSIWATMLWDMTWEIIFQDNQIVSNIYTIPANVLDMKGNIAALKLVNEGLRLQTCSPSFVDARDAILRADQMLFGGRYRCAISKAFSRRGLGLNASTGASTNDRIVTEDFTPISGNVLSSPMNFTICSGKAFNYTATSVTSGTTYTWNRPAVAGISNVAVTGNTAFVAETLVNTTNEPITVTYFFTLTPDLCGSVPAPQSVKVIVSPIVIPTVANYTICQNGTVPSGQGLVVPQLMSNTVNGNLTTSSPTFTRPTASTSFYYKAYTFVAPSTGLANFEVINAALTDGADTYLYLYQNSFNPLNPATNLIASDDDSGIGLLSLISQSVTQGTTYVLVMTTYYSGSIGTFSLKTNFSIFPSVNSWFKDATGGVALTTGTVFNPVGLAGSGIANTATVGTTTFYVENDKSANCRTAVTFTINAASSNPTTISGSISGTSSNNCAGNNTGILTLTGHSGSIIRWESSTNNFNTNTQIANNTSTLTYTNLTQTTQYRAIIQINNCSIGQSNIGTVLVTLPPTITAGTVTNPITCGGVGSIAFTATNLPNGNYSLTYTGVGLSQIVTVSNNSFQLTGLNSGTYSLFKIANLGCEGIDSNTKTLINPIPTGTANANVCYNTIATLSGSCTDGIINWYDNNETTLKWSGSPFMTNSLLVNTTFKVRCETASCVGNFVRVDVVVNPIMPTPTGTASSNICYNTIATLSGSCTDGIIKWYDNNETTLKGSGSPFMTNSLVVNTSFKVRCEIASCVGNFVSVDVVVNPIIPTPNAQANTTIFLGESVTLTATGCSGIGTALNWYKTTNNSLVTMPVLPNVTTNYYARCSQIGGLSCISPNSNQVSVSVITTLTSIKTGDWDSPSTWNSGRVPVAGIAVIIDSNHLVTINKVENAKSVEYKGTGNIVFSSTTSKLNVGI